MAQLLYGYDPMCGWCYGIIPAMRLLTEQRPDIEVLLATGGLVVGPRVQPYREMEDYISRAAPPMTARTGQVFSEAFHEMMRNGDALAASAPPIRAVLRVEEQWRERSVFFAHRLQELHFAQGRDLCDIETVHAVCDEMNIPRLDLPKYRDTHQEHPDVAPALASARALGIRSYPTVAVRKSSHAAWQQLPTKYEPTAFVEMVSQALASG